MDRLKYAEQGQEKPARGFDTSDFSRRDEFTMTFRTEQYRTLLKAGLLLCNPYWSVLCWCWRNLLSRRINCAARVLTNDACSMS